MEIIVKNNIWARYDYITLSFNIFFERLFIL